MSINPDAFNQRLSQVLTHEPTYYQLLVSSQPTRRMWDVVESLALDGDPEQPQTVLELFQEVSQGVPEEQAERWLSGLASAARRVYHAGPETRDRGLANKMMHLVYADPNLYELVAAAEPGYGLLEVVESLALEGDVNDVETMLRLMHQLVEVYN